MTFSVIVCSHNPNHEKMIMVLDSLKNQDEPVTAWELIIVDNLSEIPIASQFDFSWHPKVKIVEEKNLGVSMARARGILEAEGEMLIMVDDDAPLFPNYISTVKRLAETHPYVGCFGGNQLAISQVKPPRKYHPYLEMIGFRIVTNQRISNMYRWDTTPAGAGMAVRASIAALYADAVFNRKHHASLGRRGDSLMSSQDIDLAYNAIDQGFMNGVFPELKIYHLSIEEHLNDAYLLRRRFNNIYSSQLLNYIRFNQKPKRIPRSRYWFLQLHRLLTGRLFEYKMKKMEYKATKKLREEIFNSNIVRE